MFSLSKKKVSEDKYSSYQSSIVRDVVIDIEQSNSFKKFLVIPTGGGKTVMAIQIIDRLIKENFLKKGEKVLWGVHSRYLKTQTEDYVTGDKREELRKKLNWSSNLNEILEVGTIKEVVDKLSSVDRKNYGLLIIDEAHHSAANSYQKFFDYNMPILGLTATPYRLDAKELPFDDITKSVTFADLEKLGIITMPKKENIPTGFENKTNDISQKGLENNNSFDTEERNNFIADWIINNKRNYGYKKIIIFAGSKKHAKNLWQKLVDSNDFNGNPFSHIGYIFGGDENDSNGSQKNDKYLEHQKEVESSILINCAVLTEGYDDDSIDTVIMATPSNSIVYYMQCMGRVVRVPHDKLQKKAFLFEFVDKLPNVKYRIDNRWLYNELNQELAPKVMEHEEVQSSLLKHRVNSVINTHSVQDWDFVVPDNVTKFSLLLMNDSETPDTTRWIALPIIYDENYKNKYAELFNKLSSQIERYVNYKDLSSATNTDYIIYDKFDFDKDDPFFKSRLIKETFVNSLARSKFLKDDKKENDSIKLYQFSVIEKISLFQKVLRYIRKILRGIR